MVESIVNMGHRRFLNSSNAFWKNVHLFDGSEEYEGPPRKLIGDNVLKDICFTFGKNVNCNSQHPFNWKKKYLLERQCSASKSWLYEYWDECMWEYLLRFATNGWKNKTYNFGSRLDLKEMGIRSSFIPFQMRLEKCTYLQDLLWWIGYKRACSQWF